MDKSGVIGTFLVAVAVILSLGIFCSAQAVDISLRLGQGGLRHDSAPDGVLGGDSLPWTLSRLDVPLPFRFPGRIIRRIPMQTLPMK